MDQRWPFRTSAGIDGLRVDCVGRDGTAIIHLGHRDGIELRRRTAMAGDLLGWLRSLGGSKDGHSVRSN